jgi:hypothetical protein
VKTTPYFDHVRNRADRQAIRDEWLHLARFSPVAERIQSDGRIRRWVYIDSMQKYLRVVFLSDGRTVHSAFFDRDFKP